MIRNYILLSLFVAAASAQTFDLHQLDKLGEKTDDNVSITLDGRLLKLAAGFLSDDKDDAQVKEILNGVKAIYVRNFKFKTADAYSSSDVTSLRNQLKGEDWGRIIDLRDGSSKSSTSVYLKVSSKQVGGVAIITEEPQELTVVLIVGNVDLEKLSKLEGKFGIPKIEIDKNLSAKPKEHDE